MKKHFTAEQIIGIRREVERRGVQIRTARGKNNITEQTFRRWRRKYGGI
jgi:transposase-like protein